MNIWQWYRKFFEELVKIGSGKPKKRKMKAHTVGEHSYIKKRTGKLVIVREYRRGK